MNTTPIVDFLGRVIAALGIDASVNVEDTADGPRLNLTGDEAELLVRHRGEPLKALQHIVDSSYGRSMEGDKRVFVDALEYRKGKDIELRQSCYAYDTLAWALYKNGDYPAAAEAMNKALASEVKDAHLYFHAGVIYARAGDFAKGKACAQKALEINPMFEKFHVHR